MGKELRNVGGVKKVWEDLKYVGGVKISRETQNYT